MKTSVFSLLASLAVLGPLAAAFQLAPKSATMSNPITSKLAERRFHPQSRTQLFDSSDGDGPWDDPPKKKKDRGFFGNIKAWLKSDEGIEEVQTYTASLVLALLLRLLVVEPRYIPSLSMFPTFDIGDQLAVEKVTKRIRPFNRNEVVVFNPPEAFRSYVGERRGKDALIKRIVAVEVRSAKIAFDCSNPIRFSFSLFSFLKGRHRQSHRREAVCQWNQTR